MDEWDGAFWSLCILRNPASGPMPVRRSVAHDRARH
jgi:hypothetical protein